MNSHTGHSERALAFTVQVLKQDIGKKASKQRVDFYKQKLVWIGGKIQRGHFCNGYYSTTNLTCSIYKTDTAVEKLCEEAHKHAAFIHF